MNGKKLGVLAIAAVVLVALAVMTQKRDRSQTPGLIGTKVLPDLPVNEVTKVVISTSDQTTTLHKSAGTWVSDDSHGYPVDFSKLRQAILDLSELKIGQVVGRITDTQRQDMRMLPPGVSTNDAGTLVELYADGDKLLASLLLGIEHERQGDDTNPMMRGGYPDGRYVSPDGGSSVYLVAETLNGISVQPREWLNTEIANVQATDVASLTIAHPGEDPLVFTKKGSDLVLQDLGDDEEMNPSKSYTLKSGLSYLRFEDLAPQTLTDEAFGASNAVAYTVTTTKGETYKALIGQPSEGDGRLYLRLAVSLAPEQTEGAAEGEETLTDEAKAEKEKKAAERKALETSVADLNKRLSGWTYVIAQYKSESLLLQRADVVQAKKKPETPESAEQVDTGSPAGEQAGAALSETAPEETEPVEPETDEQALSVQPQQDTEAPQITETPQNTEADE